MKKNKWYTSILVICLALYCFFPLGFVLLYLRLKDKYGKYQGLAKILFWTGIAVVVFGILGLLVSITEPNFFTETLPIAFIVFIIPGFVCFYIGYKREKKMKLYNKYLIYINTRKTIKIEGICNNVGVDYETAINTIAEMISKEIINGYLDDDELILHKNSAEENNNYQTTEPQNNQTKIVKCKECGAKNTIVIGTAKECEYCGTILQ